MASKLGHRRPRRKSGLNGVLREDHAPASKRDLEVIHSRLNDSDFARLSTEGQKLTVDEAAALALEE
jgi:hypothetical protein